MKEMQLAYGIGMILRRLAHKNGGLIFTSVEQPYTCPHMYQWTRHSLDFRLNLVFPSPIDPNGIITETPFPEIPTGTAFRLSIYQDDSSGTDGLAPGHSRLIRSATRDSRERLGTQEQPFLRTKN
jgi:hypothetical protein